MALVRKKNYRKIFIYSVVLIIVLSIGGYLIYYAYSPGGTGDDLGNISAVRSLPIIEEYNEDFFKGEKYKRLEEFGGEKLPIDYEKIEKGRDNPFLLPI